MNIQELGPCSKVPVIVCILNNQYLGMVGVAGLFYRGRYSYTDISLQPDFVKLAELERRHAGD